jgi:hypothetical protein
VQYTRFELEDLRIIEGSPTGFLCFCPGKDFGTSPSYHCWPDLPAYWSCDPSGVDCPTSKEATELGFPAFRLMNTLLGILGTQLLMREYKDSTWAKGSIQTARTLPCIQITHFINWDVEESNYLERSGGKCIASGKTSFVNLPKFMIHGKYSIIFGDITLNFVKFPSIL